MNSGKQRKQRGLSLFFRLTEPSETEDFRGERAAGRW